MTKSKETSLCEHCGCMTYTLIPSSRCGKCNGYKKFPKEDAKEGEKAQ